MLSWYPSNIIFGLRTGNNGQRTEQVLPVSQKGRAFFTEKAGGSGHAAAVIRQAPNSPPKHTHVHDHALFHARRYHPGGACLTCQGASSKGGQPKWFPLVPGASPPRCHTTPSYTRFPGHTAFPGDRGGWFDMSATASGVLSFDVQAKTQSKLPPVTWSGRDRKHRCRSCAIVSRGTQAWHVDMSPGTALDRFLVDVTTAVTDPKERHPIPNLTQILRVGRLTS